MPRGDVIAQRGHGGGYGGGSSSYYNDEGRGASKSIWEWFERNYERSGFSRAWLTGEAVQFGIYSTQIDHYYQHRLVTDSKERFGLEDIIRTSHRRDDDGKYYLYVMQNQDSRAKRLIDKKDKHGGWEAFVAFLVSKWEEWEKQELERATNRDHEYEVARKAREAEVAKLDEQDTAKLEKQVELTAGSIRSEFANAFDTHELHDQLEGDWLDDVVSGYIDGRGFGEEVTIRTSFKLQVTVSLDLSNSMYYNEIHEAAGLAFREICTALQALKREYPDDLYTAFFTFSENGYGDSARGKKVQRVAVDRDNSGDVSYDMIRSFTDDGLNGWKWARPSQDGYNFSRSLFDGEDTWIKPLFASIERWENLYSDPGAVKLDLVLTDAVLEHPTDIRETNVIQERRDGELQTVFLNFMPESEWSKGSMPRRTIQYAVDANNIAGMLRNVLADFLAVQL